MEKPPKIAVVIPCYRVKAHVLDVLGAIGGEVARIICVDDACPEQSGAFIMQHCSDSRVKVICLSENQGVGGAVMAGYGVALEENVDIVVKLDGEIGRAHV